jgi:hypothetical protein
LGIVSIDEGMEINRSECPAEDWETAGLRIKNRAREPTIEMEPLGNPCRFAGE